MPNWRPGHGAQDLRGAAVYVFRFIVLLTAIFIAFSRPRQLSARLAALMLAAAAVGEGYPAAGWAATLSHLPAVLAIPMGLATASWLLGSVAWLAFFTIFPRPAFTVRWRWGLAIAPLAVFIIPMVTSTIAMIYAPSALAKPWPLMLSAVPVRLAQDLAGVAPLLFLNRWPLYQAIPQAWLWELWFGVTVLYLAAGFVLLAANCRRLEEVKERRRVRTLLVAFTVLVVIVVHNFLTRNWSNWFGTAPPGLFSGATFVAEAVLFQFVPLALAHAVLKKGGDDGGQSPMSAHTLGADATKTCS